MGQYSYNRFWLTGLITGLLAFSGLVSDAAETPPPVEIKELPSGYSYYTVPAGSAFHIVLQTPIHTVISQLDDPVEAIVTQNIYLDNKVLFDKNTRLFGHISRIEPPIQGRNAIVTVHFDNVKLAGGENYPISGYVKTDLPDHSWGGELTRGTVPTTIVHSVYGIGQYGKTVYSGPRMMGTHLEFLPGSYWIVLLEKPMTIVRQTESAE